MQGLTSIELVKAKVQNELPHIYFTGLKVKKKNFVFKQECIKEELFYDIYSKISLDSVLYLWHLVLISEKNTVLPQSYIGRFSTFNSFRNKNLVY